MNWLEKAGLIETENPIPAAPAPKPTATVPPPVYAPAPPLGGMTAEDQQRLKEMEAHVYATPSTYVIFRQLRSAMGNVGADAVFKTLTIANPGVTPAKVLADIETHLGVIEAQRKDFDAQVERAMADRVNGPQQKIADMQANILDLQNQISQLQPAMEQARAAIETGKAHFKVVEDAMKAPLIEAKALVAPFSS